LTDLQLLWASNTGLGGDIPHLHLPLLRDLLLRNNSLTGAFPATDLPKLWRLDVSNNKLTGTLPLGLNKTMPRLRRLWVDNNDLQGHIPYDIPFFNSSNENYSSILCGFSGNHWKCPISEYMLHGPGYDCCDDQKTRCIHCDETSFL